MVTNKRYSLENINNVCLQVTLDIDLLMFNKQESVVLFSKCNWNLGARHVNTGQGGR